jgi:hypothetical protein
MAIPATRADFKEYCLRKLGKPVIEINVDDDQVEDRIDEALRYYWDYHFDGTDKQYYRYTVQTENFPDRVAEIKIIAGGTGYSNNDTITITRATGDTQGINAAATLRTNSSGVITSITITDHGQYYRLDPTVSITTSTGSGASLLASKGGYVPLPDNIIGVVNLFPIGQSLNTNNLFNIRYQIALNDLYTLTSVSMVPYYMAINHVQFLEQMLVGQQPLRYNRHMNRAYIDMDWNIVNPGDYIVLEAYSIVDPNTYTKAWGDRWLARYAEALIKEQWGQNLKKFNGMKMPGGLTFNGQQIYNEAIQERANLEKEMIFSYSLPAADMIG